MNRLDDTEVLSGINARIWKRMYAYLLTYRGRLFWVVLTLLAVAGVDVCYPLFSDYAIDRFIVPGNTSGMVPFFLLYAFCVLFQGACVVLFIILVGGIELEMGVRIRRDAFEHLQLLSYSFYDETPVGSIMSRVISDVTALSELIAWSIVDILWSLLYMLGSLAAMLILSWKLTLIVLAVIPPLFFLSRYLQNRMLVHQRQVRKTHSRITAAFNECEMGALTTKSLNTGEANFREFSGTAGEMRRHALRSASVSAVFFPLIISLGSLATAFVLSFGGQSILNPEHALIGAISVGTLVACISYTTQLFDPIQQLAAFLADLVGAQASAERILSLLDTEPSIRDSAEVVEQYGDSIHPRPENWEPVSGEIEFQDVSFSYATGGPVFSHLNLRIPAGQKVALVGDTGAGKTTLINLISRFYEPTGGRILLDGRDYRDRSQLWLHSRIGYALQSPHLFSGTVSDNIRIGKPDAAEEEIREAARAVHAEEFILSLPNGYRTEVGEAGSLLSTGQKQLISFARVILKQPSIFLLDEPTSSIDTETEQYIQQAMDRITKGRTSLIIAHRLSTVVNCDRILVIRDGVIAEDGSHEELIRQNGIYCRMYREQMSIFRTEEELGASGTSVF